IQGSGSDAISEPDPCKDPNRLELTQSGKRGSVHNHKSGDSPTQEINQVSSYDHFENLRLGRSMTETPHQKQRFSHGQQTQKQAS
ncbi:hypothetical protein ACQXZL_10070, partial [Corynebacterium diphtheriae]